MLVPLAIALSAWLTGPFCAPDDPPLLPPVREVAPMPRPLPLLRFPETWGPRLVIPPGDPPAR